MLVETVTNQDYGIGNPLEMVMPDPSTVGAEGLKVLQKGMRSDYTALSPLEEATFKQAVENSFMFLQVSGVKGENPTGNTAEASFGLPWDRQSPMEACAESIARRIGGDNPVQWFSPHKLLVFIEGDLAPEEMLRRMVEAPREPYNQTLPHLSNATSLLQDIRSDELLQHSGNGQDFADIFNGERDPLQRAYQENGRFSFVWGCENREGRLWGINLENQPQPVSELAIDEETQSMLLAKEAFLTSAQGVNRYVVQIDFSATVSCCNISFNAQQNTDIFSLGIEIPSVIQQAFQNEPDYILNPDLVYLAFYQNNKTDKDKAACKECHKDKEACSCKDKTKS